MLIKAWFFNNLQHYIGNKLSKDTGFSISSAERYSLALFELSEENNLLSQIEEQSLSVLNLINQSKDFFNLIKDPTTSQEDLSKVINKIAILFITFERSSWLVVGSLIKLKKSLLWLIRFNTDKDCSSIWLNKLFSSESFQKKIIYWAR